LRVFNQNLELLFETANDVLIWTFCDPGVYTIELKITDISGNSYLVRRNGFVEVMSPKVLDHTLPGLGWVPPTIPPNAPVPPTPVPPPIEPPVLSVVPPLVIDTTVGNIPIETTIPQEEPPYSDAGQPIYTQSFGVITINDLRLSSDITSENNRLLGAEMVVVWQSPEIQKKGVREKEFFVDYYEIQDGVAVFLTKRIQAEGMEYDYNPQGITSRFMLDEENSNAYYLIKDRIDTQYIKPMNNSL
jgi:hypothetical protein